MTHGELSILLGLIAIVGFVIGISSYEAKKRSRIWERVDEHKDYTDSTFVRKDMCGILHKQLSKDITEIKIDLKLLLKKNGL